MSEPADRIRRTDAAGPATRPFLHPGRNQDPAMVDTCINIYIYIYVYVYVYIYIYIYRDTAHYTVLYCTVLYYTNPTGPWQRSGRFKVTFRRPHGERDTYLYIALSLSLYIYIHIHIHIYICVYIHISRAFPF